MEPIRIVVVDDQALFVSGIKMVIESAADLEFVGSARNGRAAVDVVEDHRPDIVLMDVRMPVMDGIEATREIVKRSDPDRVPRVIVLTTFHRDEAVLRAIRAGASGFITKDATPEFMIEAIRLVHAGQSVLAPQATVDLLTRFAPGSRSTDTDDRVIAMLSPREREIFLLAARGLSNAEIAAAAFVSETTVKTHVSNILAKLGLQSRVQIVVFAYENALLA
ncbi:LuxR family two component transcriptional regulator [Glaciihabitans tibetensis]|uniref:LuxR family two component transcriptional regulator n=1 Tax=Glaciihabitans tibetensis TaxID=1266600 RepID=A0A2T0VDQ1_9MICO|nr:response regulator transcription factor [Glaciihabitans tibetensis]PRY68300.1 LuxR family two component transcriptional regulator [Glaciihabitans tibetensis]